MKQQLLATLFAAAAISPFGFGLSASAAGAGSSDGEIPLIYGGLVFYDGMTGADYALCAIDPTSNRPLRPVVAGVKADAGGVAVEDTYYAAHETTVYAGGIEKTVAAYVSYSTSDWSQTGKFNAPASCIATDLAYDPVGKKAYGCFAVPVVVDESGGITGGGYLFSSISYPSTAMTAIAKVSSGREWHAMAFSPEGQLYVIILQGHWVTEYDYEYTKSTLCKVDKVTGEVVEVGDTGVIPDSSGSGAIDPVTGRFFWWVNNRQGGALYEVDLTTGHATKLYTAPRNEQFAGLYIPGVKSAKVPGRPVNLTAIFPMGQLSGTVSFTAPTSLYDGSAATGEVSYKVSCNGTVLATGNTSCGEPVSLDVTLPADGDSGIEVIMSNADGDGPAATHWIYAGNDTPLAPANFKATYADGNFSLSWDAVTQGVNGGYLDKEDVTYSVTRMPDGVKVADNVKGTSIAVPYAETDKLEIFTFELKASSGGHDSGTVKSGNVIVGATEPPYEVAWTSRDEVQKYVTIINANDDERDWVVVFPMKEFRMAGAAKGHDDWLIMPPLKLKGGLAYELTFDLHAYDTGNYVERMEVKMGTDNTVAGMTKTLLAPFDFSNTKYDDTPRSVLVKPEQDGVYYIGFHAISKPNQHNIYLKNIKVGTGIGVTTPAAVSDLTAMPDPDGSMAVTISFKLPEKDFSGNALTSISKVEIVRDDNSVAKTWDSGLTPGQSLTFKDTEALAGQHVYTVYAYNESGRGEGARAGVYAGLSKPAAVEELRVKESNRKGIVEVSWDKVDKDVNGKSINPALNKYTLYDTTDRGQELVKDKTSDTSATWTAVSGDEQKFVSFCIYPSNDAGQGAKTDSKPAPVGKAYRLPYAESFADGYPARIFRIEQNDCAQIGFGQDAANFSSQDGDNGYFAVEGKNVGSWGELSTGKINLSGVANPELSFYVYNLVDKAHPAISDRNTITVSVSDGEGYVKVKEFEIGSLGDTDGWVKVTVSLADFKDSEVSICLRATTVNYYSTFIDNMSVVSNSSGIEGVTDDGFASTPAKRTYNLQGIRMKDASAKGITVTVDTNGNVTKSIR